MANMMHQPDSTYMTAKALTRALTLYTFLEDELNNAPTGTPQSRYEQMQVAWDEAGRLVHELMRRLQHEERVGA